MVHVAALQTCGPHEHVRHALCSAARHSTCSALYECMNVFLCLVVCVVSVSVFLFRVLGISVHRREVAAACSQPQERDSVHKLIMRNVQNRGSKHCENIEQSNVPVFFEKSEISLRSESSMSIVSLSTEVILSNSLGSQPVLRADLAR